MSEIRKLFERVMNGTLIQPTVITSPAELSDRNCAASSLRTRDEPGRPGRRNFSQLLGIAAATPEEQQKTGSDSQAPTPAAGTDQAGGGSE